MYFVARILVAMIMTATVNSPTSDTDRTQRTTAIPSSRSQLQMVSLRSTV